MNSQTLARHPVGYVHPTEADAERARQFVDRWSLKATAKAWGLDPITVLRVMAGSKVQGLVYQAAMEGLATPDADMEAFVKAYGRK
jgi:hypothetical protein